MLLFIHGHKIYPEPHRLYTIAHCMTALGAPSGRAVTDGD